MIYKEKLVVSKSDYERWNFLLSKDIDDMTEEEKEKYGVKKDSFEDGYIVEFSNGSYITFDLVSGSYNYFDDIVWRSADNNTDVTFECNFEFATTDNDEFTIGDDTYIVEYEIEE